MPEAIFIFYTDLIKKLIIFSRDELRNLFRELDTAGKREGGLLAAAGALPSGTTSDALRATDADRGVPSGTPSADRGDFGDSAGPTDPYGTV